MARIVIVDDTALILGILGTMLKASGHVVLEAVDGAKGLELIESSVPDLVITDYYMPVMNGAEMIRAMKKKEKLKDIPVIALAGTVDSENQTIQAGANIYLAKPFRTTQISEAVRSLLKK
jgi:CheY-like chemotaxis protein